MLTILYRIKHPIRMLALIKTAHWKSPELEYICQWLFCEVYGMDLELAPLDEEGLLITILGETGEVRLPSTFFDRIKRNWLGVNSLPILPLEHIHLKHWYLEGKSLPMIYTCAEENSSHFDTRVDLVGSIFFLISRYEEAVNNSVDEHERFHSKSSIMGKEGLLERAIGHEYIECLWLLFKQKWPNLSRKKRSFKVLPSHDIDFPSAYWGRSFLSRQKAVLKDSLSSHSPTMFLKGCYGAISYKNDKMSKYDRFDNIDSIMEIGGKAGVKSAFYYIPEKTSQYDLGMPLNHRLVEKQWRSISSSGHEIGIHPGYETYNKPFRIQKAVDLVVKQFAKLGIRQDKLGGRQHFLRWRTPETAISWDQAGLSYDSSLGFADHSGFRCGICYEYPLYDLKNRKTLNLREKPLIVMECSVIDRRYMNLGVSQEAFDYIARLKSECKKYDGDFTLLWHNQRLVNPAEIELYRNVIT